MWPSSAVVRLSATSARRLQLAEGALSPEIDSAPGLIVLSSRKAVSYEGGTAMATWSTGLEARVEVDEELTGALMAALVAGRASAEIVAPLRRNCRGQPSSRCAEMVAPLDQIETGSSSGR